MTREQEILSTAPEVLQRLKDARDSYSRRGYYSYSEQAAQAVILLELLLERNKENANG